MSLSLPEPAELSLDADAGFPASAATTLTSRQKAAVLVHLLMSAGTGFSLQDLPETLQAELVREIGAMGPVDSDTLHQVIDEFGLALSRRGIGAVGGLPGALRMLEGSISPGLVRRLRVQSNTQGDGNPWDKVADADTGRLVPVLEREAIEVAAVILSMLPVPKAAELLGALPGDRARRIAYAMSQISGARPDAVERIGRALANELEIEPATAFDTGPVERVGAILNFSRSAVRNDVLSGLDETDATFAEEVRQAIFTFANIPERLDPRDVPKVLREVEQEVTVRALAGCTGELEGAASFILDNMSKRMAEAIRDEITELGDVPEDASEEAMTAIVAVIRRMEDAGEIFFVAKE
jgi:flagellar motor switch protein FliG